MRKSIAIIGAGAVGTNAAIFLTKLGFEVNLFDSEIDILHGSPMLSFINHGDGFEYYKKGHQTTGKYCIDGAMVKGLIYPLKYFRTNVITDENPIRFLVSNDSVVNGITPLKDFYENVELMKQHFVSQYQFIKEINDWTDDKAKAIFLRTPNTFSKILEEDDYEDLSNISGGCFGSSFGINMPHYYSYLKATMRLTGVKFHSQTEIDCIEKCGSKYYIHCNGTSYSANYILITANHKIPFFGKEGKRNFAIKSRVSGTYYLNSMTFLELPKTSNEKKIRDLKHINFTLQGEYGAMFACIVPPNKFESGLAAIYFPSVKGSQLLSNIYNKSFPISNPLEWDDLLKVGLLNSEESVKRTFDQACLFYPFLKNYARIKKTECRAVFNASVPDSPKGSDRRVREIISRPIMVSDDGRISMWTSPKWTNAELVSLIATDYLSKFLGFSTLEKAEKNGFGPTKLDISRISERLNFNGLKMNLKDALRYADHQGIPLRVVDKTLEAFN